MISFLLLPDVLYEPSQPLLMETESASIFGETVVCFVALWRVVWAMAVFLSNSCLRMKGCNMSFNFLVLHCNWTEQKTEEIELSRIPTHCE